MINTDKIINQIAAKHHTTPEAVRAEMTLALEEAQKSTDPDIQAKWATIPRKGSTPTLEEFLEYTLQRIIQSCS